MRTEELKFETGQTHFTDLTRHVREFAAKTRADGLLNVFVPHATAGLAVIETGSGSEEDLEAVLERLLPRDDRYAHSHGSLGHGADHLLPAFLSPTVTFPVVDGEVTLGTWQSIVLVDLNDDNPQRKVRITFIAA
ncbi:MAG TPA: secondary thiamine-phosphate synthase enzyme YjbQ [Actinomycetota bacterium]